MVVLSAMYAKWNRKASRVVYGETNMEERGLPCCGQLMNHTMYRRRGRPGRETGLAATSNTQAQSAVETLVGDEQVMHNTVEYGR